ncbi:hypothetical protein EDC96DRAFT_546188 [Choanephora cucurbitarum]|nr:hypothetical protein EDC96DRAFT_546188 [Choanephora cucurbitarum]
MRLSVLIALFFFLLFMGILGFAPVHLSEHINDKVLHFFVFFILSMLLYFLWDLSIKLNTILASSILIIIATGSELIQGLLPYRTFDLYDILSNILGGLLGVSLSALSQYTLTQYRVKKRMSGGRKEAESQMALMDFTEDDEEFV